MTAPSLLESLQHVFVKNKWPLTLEASIALHSRQKVKSTAGVKEKMASWVMETSCKDLFHHFSFQIFQFIKMI